MAEVITASYGSWSSPITAETVLGGALRLDEVQFLGDRVFWVEGRPREQGRKVLVSCAAGESPVDVLPATCSVRTRAHEYGGGAYRATPAGVLFSHDADRRLYRAASGRPPQAITPEGAWRYADITLDPRGGRVVCVREDHTGDRSEPENALVAVDLEGSRAPVVLARGHDFYSNPRFSPDGSHLSWLTWDHPRMPWDGSELWVAAVQADGTLGLPEKIAGGAEESLFQPEWSPEGVLHFVSDRSGWWNLYRRVGSADEPLLPLEAEFGEAQWVFGQSTYGFDSGGRLVAAYGARSGAKLVCRQPGAESPEPYDLPFTSLQSVAVSGAEAACVAGAPDQPARVVRIALATGEYQVLRAATEVEESLRPFLSLPRPIEFPTEGGRTAHAFYYPPHNPRFQAPPG
ncbi:MAG: S9 family peptidase, partial [Armatimonadetes bacterium]|nr:S9 family peptidase [Armatimonadota bacterium]